ncbi:protein split ends-like isoform X2 [Palaemon carinicauda]|uniref:protein split ends-like isoform X2 n=1 Tax=Palaemon carinicauda TaxID=392227 RepID=UPI0035B6A33E
MYAGTEANKETHNISPHIAAHKSSLAATSAPTNLTNVVLSGSSSSPHDVASNKGLSPHIPTYRVGIHVPHHSVVKGLDTDGHLLLPRHCYGNLPSNLSKSAPQDLSAHAAGGSEKAVPLELTPHTSTHHKPLPHIHTVVSQAMNSSHVGSVIPAHQSDRGSPYYRVQDPVISVQGQSCILVSTVGEGVSCHQPTSQAATLVHTQTSMPTQISATNLTTMSAASIAGTVTLPSHGHPLMASTIPQGHIMLTDCTSASAVGDEHTSALSLEPKKEKMESLENMNVSVNNEGDGTQLSVGNQQSVGSQHGTVQQSLSPQQHMENQQQSSGPQRDLVRQALQAVVTHPQHKTGNDQEVIEYNYTAGDIAELLMMNIQVNASLHTVNKGGPPPETGAQVVVLQPAAVEDTGDLQCTVGTPKQRRRPKLTEEAQSERRNKIASRMREKRAGENDDQKRLRRLREAERMRRKRATESDESKLRRRLEAAARARHRRATMSPEERVLDRQKAAARMRLRRATESDEAKAMRRMKAAERMRKRRANETPEQRAHRRQNIAMRMKTRRKQKPGDDGVNGEDQDVNNMNSRLIKCESENASPNQHGQDPLVNVSTGQTTHLSTAQLVQQGSHVAIPSSVGVGGSIALLHVDGAIPQVAITPTSVLSTVDMAQLTQSQPLPLHKSVSTSEHQVCEPIPLQKHIVASHESSTSATLSTASTHLQCVTSISEPIPLHKASSHHHHHLVHYQHSSTSHPLQPSLPQQSSHHHSLPPRHQQQQ